jgi:hypothetical protein
MRKQGKTQGHEIHIRGSQIDKIEKDENENNFDGFIKPTSEGLGFNLHTTASKSMFN